MRQSASTTLHADLCIEIFYETPNIERRGATPPIAHANVFKGFNRVRHIRE